MSSTCFAACRSRQRAQHHSIRSWMKKATAESASIGSSFPSLSSQRLSEHKMTKNKPRKHFVHHRRSNRRNMIVKSCFVKEISQANTPATVVFCGCNSTRGARLTPTATKGRPALSLREDRRPASAPPKDKSKLDSRTKMTSWRN